MSKQSAIPDHWTAAHGLGFLYMTLAFADGEFLESEVATIAARLNGWSFIECVPGTMEDVLGYFVGLGRDETAARCTDILFFLRDNMDEGNRRAVLGDLLEVAAADGRIHEREVNLLRIVKEFLEISDS